LLQEGGSNIREAAEGTTALLVAAYHGKLDTVAWLFEHGGANISDYDGATIWEKLGKHLIEDEEGSDDGSSVDSNYDTAAVTALLRVMVLRRAPPAELTVHLSPEHAPLVKEGTRLRARLPAYLKQRRTLLDVHCLLIAPLRALVHCYEVPTTTDELWAMGLDVARQRPSLRGASVSASPLAPPPRAFVSCLLS
jgi:hypothetical protein